MGKSSAKASAKRRAEKRGKAKNSKRGAPRPRQHVLEKLSARAFAKALPETMLERPLPDDYGVDFEIELFDEHGDRTGLTFKVQLKSTDSTKAKRSVKLSDFGYWSTLDVPVLLVLYMADTKQLFSKWAHAYNPWPPSAGKKTTTVKFDTLLSTHLEQIPRDLQRIREVRATVLRGPVTLGVRGDDTAEVLRLRHALRTSVGDLGARRLIQVVNDDDAHAVVSWREDAITVAAPADMGSLTIHNMEFEDITEAVGDILGVTSILLLQMGADQVAAGLLSLVRERMSDGVVDGMAMPLALVFASAHKWIELAGLIGSAPTLATAEDSISVAVMAREVMDDTAAQMFVHIARESAEELVNDGQNEAAARWLMLASVIAVEHEEWAEVDQLLARVPELTERHTQDPLLYELTGKARWNQDDSAGALEHYRRAWDLGWRSEQAVAALGEALLTEGRYREAFTHLEAAYPHPQLMTRWALLMLVSLDAIIDLTGVDEQERDPFREDETWADEVRELDDLLQLLRDRDATNAALYQRYVDASELVDVGIFVWIAVTTEAPLDWARAVLVAGAVEVDEPILRAIVEAAALTKPDIIEDLKAVQEQLKAPIPDGFLDRATTFAAGATPYEGPTKEPFKPVDILGRF